MSTPHAVCPLTADERHLLALLRQGPQSVSGVAEALRLGLEYTQDVFQRLHQKVGLVRLFRYDTLRYGLAE